MSTIGGRFTLEREVGAGGMARVYLGTDEVLDRPVAVKVLKSGFGEEEVADRFEWEGRTAARLSHPNIVQVYDAGEGEMEGVETSYIVMEYVPGGDLKQLIDEKGPLPGREVARLGFEVAGGLAHAHERGVIHRDIKPHNILLDDYGNPKLTDFGIARALNNTEATRTGTYLGTAMYSSPEQLQGEKATPKSDVYSLGVTLYQAATGEPPFSGAMVEVASQHASREPTPPRDLSPSLERGIEGVILDCLAKDPGLRPSAAQLRDRLARVADSAAAPAHEWARNPAAKRAGASASGDVARRNSKRSSLGAAIFTSLAVVALAGTLAVLALLWDEGDRPVAAQGARKPANAPSAGAPGRGNVEEQPRPSVEPVAQRPASVDRGARASLSEAAASRMVEKMYVSAARGDYRTSYAVLSEDYRRTIAPRAWSSQFDTLQRIQFIEGPAAAVYGNTATVTGTTIATHTGWTETNAGTWTLVNEGGRWKVSGISVQSA